MPDVILIGQFPVAVGAITAILGGFLTYWMAGLLARRNGMDPDPVQDAVLNLGIGAIAGAKLFYVAQDPMGHLANPVTLILFPYGPWALPAGLITGAAAVAWGLRKRPDRLAVLDSAALALPAGLAVAALGWRGPGMWAFAPALAAAAAATLMAARSPAEQGRRTAYALVIICAALVLADLARPVASAGGVSPLQVVSALAGTGGWLWLRRNADRPAAS